MYSMLFGWVGWRYIPPFATQHLLRIVYQLSSTYLGYRPPPPGTLQFRQHYRLTYSIVVLGYLLYNMIESSRNLPPNFYQILGVYPDVDENGLKVAFRQFAKRFHPDRPGVGRDGEALFIMVRDVFEALKNPVVRFAYDRFGPDVLTWQHLSTQREYLRQGLMRSSGYHIVSGFILLFYSTWSGRSSVTFWRYILFASLFVFELGFLLHPSPSPDDSLLNKSILTILFPQRVAFQHILFLHQFFLFMTAAVTNVAPYLFPETDEAAEQDAALEGLNSVAAAADREASILLHTELHSIHPRREEDRVSTALMNPFPNTDLSSEVMELLTAEMERMVVEKNVMAEAGPLRSVWEKVLRDQRVKSEVEEEGQGALPPSPVSRSGSPEVERKGKGKGKGKTMMPLSPRTTPPPLPGLERRGSSYTRARSVSY